MNIAGIARRIRRYRHLFEAKKAVMDIADIAWQAETYQKFLKAKKRKLGPQPFQWYLYDTMYSFQMLDRLLTKERRNLLQLAGGQPIADIGGADGDAAFFLESLGCKVHFVDHGPTNMNQLQAVRLLKKELGSQIEIHDVDLDSQFQLPQTTYGLVLFLGILYHLKNPYYALEALAKSAKYAAISTKVAQVTPDKQTVFKHVPMAYLLDERETNNDPTNYWIFSDAGLRRILKRTGWEICDYMNGGNTNNSDPVNFPEGDERVFCFLKSRWFN